MFEIGFWKHVGSKMAPLRSHLGQPAETGLLAIASKTRRRRYSLYFQSKLSFPSWTSRVRVPSPAPSFQRDSAFALGLRQRLMEPVY